METILDTIVAKKAIEIEISKKKASFLKLEAEAGKQESPRGFARALESQAKSGPAIIAEVKRGSPSLGCIRPDLDAAQQVAEYERGGAACLSVLTDEKFFFAQPDDFAKVRDQVGIPMLRKDFMVEEYQILQSRALGADCVLLIMACLPNRVAQVLAELAHDLGMDVLCETHDEEEISRALDWVDYDLLGINNRNLKTFSTSWQRTIELADLVPDRSKLVAESGLHTADVIRSLWGKDIQRFLIGEAFVKSDDPAATIDSFIQM